MSKIDQEFKKLCLEIKQKGKLYNNVKRGVKRLQIPSYTFRHEFKDGFPAISIKHLPYKSVVSELLWFLSGDNDIKFLKEHNNPIWDKDAWNWHKKEGGILSFDDFVKLKCGSVGQNYSVQWRNYNGNTDQVAALIEGMKADIMSSQLIVNAWNPSELKQTALAPCHTGFQIIGIPNEGFELHWSQRSVDTFLGIPFNIASYATLAKILEIETGHKALAIQGDLKCIHFYDNQFEAVEQILTRDENKHQKCELEITSKSLVTGFNLINYTYDESIRVEMLAPLEI